jgi:hypothetical protein
MNSKRRASVGVNFSLRFALLSPVIGAFFGILGLFVLCH